MYIRKFIFYLLVKIEGQVPSQNKKKEKKPKEPPKPIGLEKASFQGVRLQDQLQSTYNEQLLMKLTSNSKQGRVHVHVIIRGLGSRLVQRNFRWAQVLTIIMKVTVSPIPSRIQFHLSCTSPSFGNNNFYMVSIGFESVNVYIGKST